MGGLGKKGRSQLSKILRHSKGVITPLFAADTLGLSRHQASMLLATWHRAGWLNRPRRGIYIPVSLESETPTPKLESPWILAQELFSPCYIGGWSAAEYWGLTEQVFASTYVFTTKKLRSRELDLNGNSFKVRTCRLERIFGTTPIWVERARIEISDATRTIVDCLNDPDVVGGIRMAVDIFREYMRSEHRNASQLIQYATKFGNGAVFKRLGFLCEREFPQETTIIATCRENLSTGYARLDPALKGGSLITRWNLWVPRSWSKEIPE